MTCNDSCLLLSCHFMIPFTCMWDEPSDLLLMNWTQQRWWDGVTKTRFKSDCHLLAQLSLVFLLACSDEASCHVVGGTIERSNWQGTEGSFWPTASENWGPKSCQQFGEWAWKWTLSQLNLMMTALLVDILIDCNLKQNTQPSLTWIPDLLKLKDNKYCCFNGVSG